MADFNDFALILQDFEINLFWRCSSPLRNSLFRPDEQRELDLENDYLNRTGYNLKTTCSVSVL